MLKQRFHRTAQHSWCQRADLRPRIARLLMLVIMVNAMVLGFLSSTHASARLSGMALICGPNGVYAIPLADQQPDDLSLVDRERCITACLAALTGTPGLVVDGPQIHLPPLRFESPKPEVILALTPVFCERPKARGPPA